MQLVTPSLTHGRLFVVQGSQSALKGHVYTTKLDTAAITDVILPRGIEHLPFRVLLTGQMSKKQVLLVKECALIRRRVLRELLDWFIPRNDLYSHLQNHQDEMEAMLQTFPVDGVPDSLVDLDLEGQFTPFFYLRLFTFCLCYYRG